MEILLGIVARAAPIMALTKHKMRAALGPKYGAFGQKVSTEEESL
jgi:hypothetical protein